MALAINNRELLISTISFVEFEIDFNLDLDISVSETKKNYFDDTLSNVDDKVYLDGNISFRSIPSDSATYQLISGQDMGPLHVFFPRFRGIIQKAVDTDLSNIVPRGQLSATIKNYNDRYYAKGDLSAESTFRLLQQYSVVESYLGRICFYRHHDKFLLEIEKMYPTTEIFIEIVAADELSFLLGKLENHFHQAVLEILGA